MVDRIQLSFDFVILSSTWEPGFQGWVPLMVGLTLLKKGTIWQSLAQFDSPIERCNFAKFGSDTFVIIAVIDFKVEIKLNTAADDDGDDDDDHDDDNDDDDDDDNYDDNNSPESTTLSSVDPLAAD